MRGRGIAPRGRQMTCITTRFAAASSFVCGEIYSERAAGTATAPRIVGSDARVIRPAAMHLRCACLLAAAIGLPALVRADMWTEPARYRVEYRVDLPAIAAKPGQRLRVWVPYPATSADQ